MPTFDLTTKKASLSPCFWWVRIEVRKTQMPSSHADMFVLIGSMQKINSQCHHSWITRDEKEERGKQRRMCECHALAIFLIPTSSAHQTISFKTVLILASRVIFTGVTSSTPKARVQETMQVRWEERHHDWAIATSTEAAQSVGQAYSGKE